MNLNKVPASKRKALKTDIGEFVVNEVIRSLSSGKSPVSKEKFAKLNKEYAKREKNGNRTPNLQLEGDLLEALDFRNTKSGVAVGITKAKERPKADGHNNFSGDSKLPKRRFIPANNQQFNQKINREIKKMVKDAEVKAVRRAPVAKPLDVRSRLDVTSEFEGIEIGVNFDNQVDALIRELFGESFNG